MSAHDLVIRGGTVVDGNGGRPFLADVAVDGGVVTAIGRDAGRGRREVDADGAVVAPGFIDIHTHYDGQATWDERLLPSAWHGVTTVVMGNCGVGFAPVTPDHQQRLIDLMEGVEDIPGTALHEGLSWEWLSFDDYLAALEARPHDIDFAAQVPHAALRVHVMGERAQSGRAASGDDIAAMAKLARAGVEAGALGFTTSRTLNHRSVTGELTPSYDAGGDELVGIAAELGAAGRGNDASVGSAAVVLIGAVSAGADDISRGAATPRSRQRRGLTDARAGRRSQRRAADGAGVHTPPVHDESCLAARRRPAHR